MITTVVCDWNRTLFEDAYDIELFQILFKKTVFRFPNILNLRKLHRLREVKEECEKLYSLCLQTTKDEQKSYINYMLEEMNRNFIEGIPEAVLKRTVHEYASKASPRLDHKLLSPLISLRNSQRLTLGVISSGCRVGIIEVLKVAGYSFDFVVANDFVFERNRAKKFALHIFDNKGKILSDALEKLSLRTDATMYIGDNWQDEDCFAMVRFPVVSFFADQEDKSALAQKFNAFVPQNQDDFERYLRDCAHGGVG